MTWKTILKSEGIEPVIDFIRTEMIPKMGRGEGSFLEYGTMEGDVSITAMELLRRGRSSPYNQIDDEKKGVSVTLHIDDGFDLRIRVDPDKSINREYGFYYANQFDYLDEDPVIVAGLVEEFLKLIGRSDMEHGMTLEHLNLRRD